MSKKNELVIKSPSKDLLAFSEKVADIIGFNPIKDIFEIGNRTNAVAQLLAHPDVADILEKLENTPAGFLTDKKAGEPKYTPVIRAQAMQICFSQGAKPTGNEINIIRGKGMLVKNYYRRMIDFLGHPKMPSESCTYKMLQWHHTEEVETKGNGLIKFKCTVSGKWYDKALKKAIEFDWKSDVSVSYGGQYDTVDKAQGQVQRRAWQMFYERHAGIYLEDQLQHDPDAIEPELTQVDDVMTKTKAKEYSPDADDADIVDVVETEIATTSEEMSKPVDNPAFGKGPESEDGSLLGAGPQEGDLF